VEYNYQPIITNIGHDGIFLSMPQMFVSVSGKDGSRTVSALLDSGAAVSVADIGIAKSIGAVLDKKKGISFGGITAGAKEPAYPARVKIKVEGFKEITTTVYFAKISKAYTLILGQEGFFDRFTITFQKKKDTFEIKPAK